MTPTVTIHQTLHATDIFSNVSHTCPGCKQSAYWWKNMDGQTRCIACAPEVGSVRG